MAGDMSRHLGRQPQVVPAVPGPMAGARPTVIDELEMRLDAERMLAEQRIGWCSCRDRDGAGRPLVGCGVCDLPSAATVRQARRVRRRLGEVPSDER